MASFYVIQPILPPGMRTSWLDWYVVPAEQLSATKRRNFKPSTT